MLADLAHRGETELNEPVAKLLPPHIGVPSRNGREITLRDLAQEGRTMLVVTHEMAFAREVSNRVVFMNQGFIEEQGAPADLFESPKSERLCQFLSRVK